MLTARSIYEQIRSNDETYALFLSVAAKGENQGGWENERIAALTRDPVLAEKIARHGRDEDKHGRIFTALLRKRGLQPVAVPPEADYCMQLERAGIGLTHARLHETRPLNDEEILRYLVHSRVTEQRASEEVALQAKVFGDDPEIGKAVRMIADDEVNHLAYCNEELLRFAGLGYAEKIRTMARSYALAEIRVYRTVSLEIMRQMGAALGWPRAKRTLLAAAIQAIYESERFFTWRRMTTLRPPERRNAMGTDAPPVRLAS